MSLLKGKNIIITGGTRGIGKGIVDLFVEHQANVAFTYHSSDNTAKQIMKDLSNDTSKVIAYKSDASDFNQAQKLIDDVLQDFGSVDVLINNAGITKDNLLLRMSEEDFDAVMKINLKSVFNLTKAVLRPMLKQKKGVIINISSIYGLVGPDQRIYGKSRLNSPAFYSATKGALVNLTRYLAAYWHQKNIRVNTLTLGGVFDSKLHKDKNFVKNYSNKTMMGRMGKKEDFDGALLFLASDASGYVTGTNIVVDGGWTAW